VDWLPCRDEEQAVIKTTKNRFLSKDDVIGIVLVNPSPQIIKHQLIQNPKKLAYLKVNPRKGLLTV
jgi:hypothetical protein